MSSTAPKLHELIAEYFKKKYSKYFLEVLHEDVEQTQVRLALDKALDKPIVSVMPYYDHPLEKNGRVYYRSPDTKIWWATPVALLPPADPKYFSVIDEAVTRGIKNSRRGQPSAVGF